MRYRKGSETLKNIKFDTLAGGLLKEQFAKAFSQVIENLADVNTPYKNARSITIKLSFKQNEKRDDVAMTATVETKLAAQTPTGTSFAVGRDLKSGKMIVEEYGKNLAGQFSVEDYEVDSDTGEVSLKPEVAAGVIDFPRVMEG